MSYPIEDIQGIGPAYAEKLAVDNIKTTEDLLDRCAGATGRKQVSEKTGLNESQLLNWTNLADLMRISGIGPQYSELLEGAGVDTVKELRHRNAENLAAKMEEVNEQMHLARITPAAATVKKWVAAAKETEPKVTY